MINEAQPESEIVKKTSSSLIQAQLHIVPSSHSMARRDRLLNLHVMFSTPRHALTLPAQECGIIVDQVVVDSLCDQIPISRKESMPWVDDHFEVTARDAYSSIGEPFLDSDLLSGWQV